VPWFRRLKQRFVNWLLRDVVVERLKARYVVVGDPAKLLKDGTVVFAPLTADPSTLEAGKLWYRSDIDEWRYSPDGTTTKQLGGGYQPDNTYICLDTNNNLTICDNSVDTTKLKNASVTYAKLKISTGTAAKEIDPGPWSWDVTLNSYSFMPGLWSEDWFRPNGVHSLGMAYDVSYGTYIPKVVIRMEEGSGVAADCGVTWKYVSGTPPPKLAVIWIDGRPKAVYASEIEVDVPMEIIDMRRKRRYTPDVYEISELPRPEEVRTRNAENLIATLGRRKIRSGREDEIE